MTTTSRAEDRVDVRQARAGLWWNIAAIVVLFAGLGVALAGLGRLAPPMIAAGILCGLAGHWSCGFAAGFRQGTATAALTLASRISEQVPPVDPDRPGFGFALRETNDDRIDGWGRCEQHGHHRYRGPDPCDPLHQATPDAPICGYHLRAHGPAEFGQLCTAWAEVEHASGRHRRYLRWLNH